MNLILTMAGRNPNRETGGYNIPRYLLPWGTSTVLNTILNELIKKNRFRHLILVANHADEAFMPHVRRILDAHGIPQSNLILHTDTSGQVETARVAIKSLKQRADSHTDPLVIHNVDTILTGRDLSVMSSEMSVASGYVDTFHASNRRYSYVLVNKDGRVEEIAEKVVVSDLATSGLYGFSSFRLFEEYSAGGEVYVSQVLRSMIGAGLTVKSGLAHNESDTIVLGTPEEYANASTTQLV